MEEKDKEVAKPVFLAVFKDTKVMTNALQVGEHDLTKSDGEKYVRVCSKSEHPNYDSRKTIHPKVNQMMKRNYVHFFVANTALSLLFYAYFSWRERKRGNGRVMATKKFTEFRFIQSN